jgi:hypothetical protein
VWFGFNFSKIRRTDYLHLSDTGTADSPESKVDEVMSECMTLVVGTLDQNNFK